MNQKMRSLALEEDGLIKNMKDLLKVSDDTAKTGKKLKNLLVPAIQINFVAMHKNL